MSVQKPPVTVITLPPTTTTTTEATTTSTQQPSTTVDTAPAVTTAGSTEAPITTAPTDQQTGGIAGVVISVVFVAVIVAVVVRMRRRSDPPVVVPPGPSLTERVRAAVDRAEHEEPHDADHYEIADVSVADLYPWIQPPDDLTLVVDLRTAEALQGVGVTSLDQLVHLSDETIRSMVDAGIDIDTTAVGAAAQDIIDRRGRAR